MNLYSNKHTIAIFDILGDKGGMLDYHLGTIQGLKSASINAIAWTSSSFQCKNVRNRFRILWLVPKVIRIFLFFILSSSCLLEIRLKGITKINFHFFHYNLQNRYLLLIARILGLHIILTIHDIQPFGPLKNQRVKLQFFLKKADLIIVHNEDVKYGLQQKFDLTTEIFVAKHGNYIKDKRQKFREITGLKQLAVLGRMKREKGVIDALQMMTLSGSDDLHLMLAGKCDDDFAKEIREFIASNHLYNKVTFIPRYLNSLEFESSIQATDLCLFPYNKVFQSGLVLHVMSLGIPVLCSDLPFFKDLITHGKTGLLYKSGDIQSFMEVVMEIKRGNYDLNYMREQAFSMVKSEYSWEDSFQGINQYL